MQLKVLVNNLAIFFLCPSKQFLTISFQIQLLEYLKTKAARLLRISWLPLKFRSLKILGPYKLTVYILLHRMQTEAEVAEKSSWDQANRGEKFG
jgi:hypothetical protein